VAVSVEADNDIQFWLDGLNPYSDEVTRRVEIGMRGRPSQGDENPGGFVYPFYTVFTLWPLVLLPYDWVQAIWIVLLAFLVVLIGYMSMWLLRWRIGLPAQALMILFVLFLYYSVRAVLLGQYAVVVAALVIGSFLAIRSGRDGRAGVMLALSTIKPNMIFLIIPYLLLWAVFRRRWRMVWSFALAVAILIATSFLLIPTWLSEYLDQLDDYTSYTAIGSPMWVVVQHYLGLGDAGEAIAATGIGLILVVVWMHTLRDDRWGTFQYVCGLTLIVTNLIILRTATTHYVILYPVLWLVAKSVIDRSPRGGKWIVAAGMLVLLVGLWTLFVVTVVGKQEHPLMYLPLPLGLAFALVAWRRSLIEAAESGACSIS